MFKARRVTTMMINNLYDTYEKFHQLTMWTSIPPAFRLQKKRIAMLLYCTHHQVLVDVSGLCALCMKMRLERPSALPALPRLPTAEFGMCHGRAIFYWLCHFHFRHALFSPSPLQSTSTSTPPRCVACTWTGHPSKLETSFYRRPIFFPN